MVDIKTVSRRKCFMQLGAASLGSVALMNPPVQAQSNRIDSSLFGYRFKTFGPNDVIRIGMIGTGGNTGRIGRLTTLIEDVSKIKNVKLVACSNYDDPNLKLPSDIKLYKEYMEMLDKEHIDIVVIFLPYYRNAETSIAVAQRGIHIISDKPIATTLDDLNRLLKTVISNRVRLTVLISMRLEPPYQAIHTAIAEGKIGEPILASAQKTYKFGASRPDFYKIPEMYGGTIPWIGIYFVDCIHYTTNLDYTEVVAFQGNKAHPDYPGCQDYAGAMFTTNNGGTAMVNMDFLRPATAPSHGDDRLRVIGSDGVIEIKDLAQRVELISSKTKPVDLQLPEAVPYLADFIKELRGQGTHIIRPEEPFEMTRAALLANQSSEQKRVIKL